MGEQNHGIPCGRGFDTSIAVIGMACRFPGGVASPGQFWDLLNSRSDPIGPIPPERWSLTFYGSRNRNLPGRAVAMEGGFLQDVEGFDYEAFHISSAEAPFLDPQHRLFLMVTGEALEHAGIPPGSLAAKNVGVYAGAFTHDYLHLQLADPKHISAYTATGGMGTMLSARVSHAFDFRGPAMTVDTACSSSLLAVHLACESLRRNECELAVAGGSQLMFLPDFSIAESQAGMLSLSNRCRSFSRDADGYVRSEGVGAVILKRLSDAQRDADRVLAVIRGSAVNQDGRTPTITRPNPDAQMDVVRAACAQAGVSPGDLDYVEAHGTGTPAGDPAEATALGTVCRIARPPDRPLLLGACKSVIGHTEAAAGVAGLIKAVLCLQHRRVPPNLHFECPNPHIPFSDLQIRVADDTCHLPSGRVLAGVNAFGFGGTNVHVVLESSASMPITQESARYSASESLSSSPRWHLKPCWRESDMSLRRRTRPSDGALLGSRPSPSELTWDSELDMGRCPWIEDHVVLGEAIFPAAAYAEIMNAAGKAAMPEACFSLEDLMLERTLSLKPTGAVTLRTRLDPARMTLRIEDASRGTEPVSLARARLRRVPPGTLPGDASWIEARSRCNRVLTAETLYAAFGRQRYEYRGVFRTLIGARVGEAEAVCELNLPPAPEGMSFHPAALDGVFQSLLAAQAPMEEAELANACFRIPYRIGELRIFGPLEGRLISHAVLEEGAPETEAQGRVEVYDAGGRRVCYVRGFRMRAADARKRTSMSSALFCRPLWSEIVFPSSAPAVGAWALLGGSPAFRARLAGDLRHRGGTVVECPRMPRNAQEAARMAEKISKEAERAVVLWPAADESAAESTRACQAQIRLIQALGAQRVPVPLWTVTCGAHRVLPEDRIENPFAAAPWGLMRALCQQDARAFWGGLIDMDADISASRLADALLAMDGEDQVALRGGRRYALRLEQPHGEAPRSEVRFHAEGAYVVTGGLGALGSRVAQWMVRKGARQLLIMGRRRNPGPHGKQRLAHLRSMGAEVDYASVPLDDLDALADYLRAYRQAARFPIRGLIHCAAHSEDQAWRDIDAGAFRRVFAAKAQAAWNLHLALEADPLEHFVLFSSLGGLLSLPGMASYAAANVVLDSLAQLRRALGRSGLSIDWGPWSAGLAARDARTLDVFRCYGLPPLSPEEGLEWLERLYFYSEAQAVVFAADRNVLGASPFSSLPLLERLALAQCRDDPAQASGFPESGDCQTTLHEICAAILETDPRKIHPDEPLSTYGLDSLNRLLLTHQVQSRWGVELPSGMLAADPPLAELAAFIAYHSCAGASAQPSAEGDHDS